MPPFIPPPGYTRIRIAAGFDELVSLPLRGDCNAICWPRRLAGDFDEIVRLLAPSDDITAVDPERLVELPASAAGRAAIETLLADQERLRARGHSPQLECVRAYARDSGPVPTDVHSFHVDRADVPTDTFLCTYTGPASQGLRNDQARRLVDDPTVRARLLAQFGGDDGPAFAAHLAENSFDLHYAPMPGATPFEFGIGNLWRLAVQHPASSVPACIHRAPDQRPGQLRLLLIS